MIDFIHSLFLNNFYYMKRKYAVPLALLLVFTGLAFASNFIQWDETSLEHSLWGFFLGLGFALQLPFYLLMAPIATYFSDNNMIQSYDATINTAKWLFPILTGLLYTGIFLIVWPRIKEKNHPGLGIIGIYFFILLLTTTVTAVL